MSVPQSPPPAGSATAPEQNSNATIAIVLSLVSWLICPIILAIGALVYAGKARKEIAQSGGTQSGSGMVTAARVIAWINIVFYAIVVVGFLAFYAFFLMADGFPSGR